MALLPGKSHAGGSGQAPQSPAPDAAQFLESTPGENPSWRGALSSVVVTLDFIRERGPGRGAWQGQGMRTQCTPWHLMGRGALLSARDGRGSSRRTRRLLAIREVQQGRPPIRLRASREGLTSRH